MFLNFKGINFSLPNLAFCSQKEMETMLGQKRKRVKSGHLHSLVAFLGTFWPGGAGHWTRGAGPARPGQLLARLSSCECECAGGYKMKVEVVEKPVRILDSIDLEQTGEAAEKIN